MNDWHVAFLVLVGVCLFASPRQADAQGTSVPHRIAFLISDDVVSKDCSGGKPDSGVHAFREELRSLGYTPKVHVDLACRSAESKYERLHALARELVELRPAVIVAAAAPASLAVQRATSTIPVISIYTADPVGLGLVKTLARPGGNITGVSALAADYVAKSLQLLKEADPRISRVGVVGDGRNPTFEIYRKELEPAARALGLSLEFVAIKDVPDFEPAFVGLRKRRADAFLVMHQPITYVKGKYIAEVAGRHGVPTVFGTHNAIDGGGLISYTVSVPDVYRRAAHFVDKILKGAKPADLPVEQPMKFELAINLKTAKALGLTIPQSLLLRADRVIE